MNRENLNSSHQCPDSNAATSSAGHGKTIGACFNFRCVRSLPTSATLPMFFDPPPESPMGEPFYRTSSMPSAADHENAVGPCSI